MNVNLSTPWSKQANTYFSPVKHWQENKSSLPPTSSSERIVLEPKRVCMHLQPRLRCCGSPSRTDVNTRDRTDFTCGSSTGTAAMDEREEVPHRTLITTFYNWPGRQASALCNTFFYYNNMYLDCKCSPYKAAQTSLDAQTKETAIKGKLISEQKRVNARFKKSFADLKWDKRYKELPGQWGMSILVLFTVRSTEKNHCSESN